MRFLALLSLLLTSLICYLALRSIMHRGGENYAVFFLELLLPLAGVQAVLTVWFVTSMLKDRRAVAIAIALPAISIIAILVG